MTTGFVRPLQEKAGQEATVTALPRAVNTRDSLWPQRWPVVALEECIEKIEAAPLEEQSEVARGLPCSTCPEAGRCLTAKRKEIGPIMYDRELQTTPRSSGSSLFSLDVFRPCLHDGIALVPLYRKPLSVEHHLRVVQAWDLAWSERIGGDWLVCMTGLLDLRDGTRTLLDVMRWQQIGFDEQVKLIEAQWKQFEADLVVIESDAAQSIWAKHVGKNTAVPVLQHSAGDKGRLDLGVPGLLIKLANRKWVFPYRRDSYHRENLDTFLSECEAFSWVDGKLQGVGEHDDTVMCWWHLDWGMDRLSQGMREEHRGVQDGRH